ncbi:uncharacterized protein AMSG_07949 [Thecamonas trahens ATCC 50062]|uniref:Uncharacterized protein n=1 Tax=Thecamonas trahens ATCC 50062 TaxID=461836 RepID=A0A0L0DHR8_THETB|nr:hypothetical protein AMSG_07949 [Thecamonas trahens ATCC 50062]KNC51857.1 hypothetical protein AMSG_07949 [Thecamonas trahens ATCC 50062]|eukprot:XP_013755718.1 hypothetical protein AMSG_07949 [Thecamonas trahens ATCC 50062]
MASSSPLPLPLSHADILHALAARLDALRDANGLDDPDAPEHAYELSKAVVSAHHWLARLHAAAAALGSDVAELGPDLAALAARAAAHMRTGGPTASTP